MREVCGGRYDVVQINESNEIESYLLSSKLDRLHVPHVIYQGMYNDLSGRVQRAWQWVFARFALPKLRKSTGLVFAKTESANRFVRSKGFPRVETLPVGLDYLTLDRGDYENWRDLLAIPRNAKIVLYVGKLEPRRNTWLMMSLAEKMQDSPVFFVFAGTGVDFESAKAYATNHRLSNVRFLGCVPQRKMKSLYEEAYCLVLASDYEIYGMVILEAMYYGVPVVATRNAGSEQIISDNEDGIVLDGVDEGLWMEALTSLISDQERRSRLANKARAKIVDAYTWDNIAERYELIISSICLR
jgi:glycosyltransferase involved in cell wall biosynthesis